MTFEKLLQEKIDFKTKPLKSLGLLESLAFKIGKIQQTLTPKLVNPTIVVFAADHGIAKENVSAYPQEVTFQMVSNFLNHGAAINVFCKQNNIDLKIVDAGVNHNFPLHTSLIEAKAGYGTKNMLKEKAMTEDELLFCFKMGEKVVRDIAKLGTNVIGFGEMGIGNTSSSSLLMSTLLNIPVDKCVGNGTGLNAEQLQNKKKTLTTVLEFHPKPKTVEEVLMCFGGFEIAQMCSAMLEAYKQNMIILVDGFIASSAFLCANRINPKIIDNAIFCHKSGEVGHTLLLRSLGQKAILDMGLRLGEGTGCALAYPIIENAVAFLNNMASFQTANVSNK